MCASTAATVQPAGMMSPPLPHLVSALLALAVAACGGDAERPGQTDTATAAATATRTPAVAPATITPTTPTSAVPTSAVTVPVPTAALVTVAPTPIPTSAPPTPAPTVAPTIAPSPLKTLAEKRGIRFGALYQYDIRSDLYDRIFETEMKVMTLGAFWRDDIRRTRAAFDFAPLDAEVTWGRERDMDLYGQTLVWFEDIPDWLKATPTADVEGIMNEHIDVVVGRYAGRIKAWNVVNEAVNSDGTLRRNHTWAVAMGNDYIRKAFIRAHAADPTAALYYNDFDIESNQAKFDGVKVLLISLKDQGVAVHALGWQLHVKPSSFVAATLLARMNEIADLGFDNYITELDVELPADASKADYEQQKQTYKTIVETFLTARRHKTIAVWGLRDGDPYWLTNGHPLLFDESYRKKPAYFGVQEALT